MEAAVEETAEAPEAPEASAAPKDTQGQEPEEKAADGEEQEVEPTAHSTAPEEEKAEEEGSGGGENAVLRVIDPTAKKGKSPPKRLPPMWKKG